MSPSKYPVTLCLFLILSVSSCRPKSTTQVKSFESLDSAQTSALPIPGAEIPASEFRVRGLSDLGISHTVKRLPIHSAPGDLERNMNDPYSNFYTDVQFGPITKEQYGSLVQRYGGMTSVPFVEGKKDWRLIDFLPPLTQALDGHRFIEQKMPVPSWISSTFMDQNRLDPDLLMQTNCFATAYEVSRSILKKSSPPQFTAFFLGNVSMESFFWGKYNEADAKIGDISWFGSGGAEKRNTGRKLGDVSLFLNPAYLHGAVWIDNDLYFEKIDTKSAAPYRLVTFSDMTKSAGLAEALASGVPQVKFIRFLPEKLETPEAFFGGKSSHPTVYAGKLYPGETFKSQGMEGTGVERIYVAMFSMQGGGNAGSLNALRSFTLQKNASNGRFELPKDAFDAGTFVP